MVQKTLNRGKVIFKEGDSADGVYLIVSGSFEISTKKNYTKSVEEEAEKLRIDPIASFKLKQQTHIQHDKGFNTMKIAVVGKGEIMGLEEC